MKAKLDGEELYHQHLKFAEMADNAHEPEERVRYAKLSDVYLTKYNEYISKPSVRRQKLIDRVTKTHGSFETWYDWAKSLYDVSPEWNVTSRAANWKEPKIWSNPDEISALEKIEQLIGYKDYDHTQRVRV